MQDPNFLILDEPTNDLDIQTLEVLEEYLQDFPGCVIVVSHDRFFTDKVVDHLLVFHGNGEIQDFPGNYSQYREWKQSPNSQKGELTKTLTQTQTKSQSQSQNQNQNKKPKLKTKLSYKEQRELEQLEKDLAALEEEKKLIVEQLSSGNIPNETIISHSKRLPELESLIDEKETRWLELQE